MSRRERAVPIAEPARDERPHRSDGRLATVRRVEPAAVLVRLDEPIALDPAISGAKAANLARCAAAGLPTLEGVVITTEAVRRGFADHHVATALERAWAEMSGDGSRAVVVRSSSTVEDAAVSSMAGRFTSILDVHSVDDFRRAVDTVARSAEKVDAEAPMAILVQPHLEVRCGGVMFGVDPLSGRPDRIVVDVVRGGPHMLVDGSVTADHVVMTTRGHVVEHRRGRDTVSLSGRERRHLARIATRAHQVLGSPQDIEWAIDRAGRLIVLQSRPVTAIAGRAAAAVSPRLGAGPVAETFPRPLTTLERELWMMPLRDGITRALDASRAVSVRDLDRSPVVDTVDGRVVVDLDLLGVLEQRDAHRWRHPIGAARRLRAAWTIGALRATMPARAARLVADVDAWLISIGPLHGMSDRQLVGLLVDARDWLGVAHTEEVLCGMLLDGHDRASDDGPNVAGTALAVWKAGAAIGMSIEHLVAMHPVVLALWPPSIVENQPRRAESAATMSDDPHRIVDRASELPPRDALRLRIRWLHELQVRVARTLGARWSTVQRLEVANAVAHLHLGEVEMLAADGEAVFDAGEVSDRRARWEQSLARPPLPRVIRLAADGTVIPQVSAPASDLDRDRVELIGVGASRGRAIGEVVHDPDAVDGPSTRRVLVAEHLDPALATVLPRVAAVVAETGSPLSHLAILAREAGIPAVVAVDGAKRRLPPGCRVVVDGDTGRVDVVERVDGTHRDDAVLQ